MKTLTDDAGVRLLAEAIRIAGSQMALASIANISQGSISLAINNKRMTSKFLTKIATALKRRKAGEKLSAKIDAYVAARV